MKKLLLGLTLIIPFFGFGQIDFSQDFDVELSRPYEVVDGQVKEYFSVNKGEQIISIKVSGNSVTVHLFDVADMAEVKRHTITNFHKYAKFIDIVYVDDSRFYYIYEVYNKSEKTFTVYSRTVDVDGANLEPKDKLFTTKDTPARNLGKSFASLSATDFNWMGLPIIPHFYVNTSFDKSKILISYRNKPLSKKDKINKDVIGMHVFDASMESVWGDEITMPYTEAQMNNMAYGIGNKGFAYILIKNRKDKSFELLAFKEDELVKHPLDIDSELMFQRFFIHEKENGDILCTGLYANGMDIKVDWTGNVSSHFNTDGMYIFTLTKDGDMVSKYKLPFDIDFIGLYLSEKQRKKLAKREAEGKAGISDLKVEDIHINEDGSMVFVCERQWYKKTQKGTSTKMVYYYANMVVLKVSADGEVQWITKLPKQQEGYAGRGEMSLKYIHGKDYHYIVYVDNAKNANLGVDEVPARHVDGRGGVLSAYVLDDENGQPTKHLIFDTDDLQGVEVYQFMVSRIFEAVPGTFLTEVYLKKKKDGIIKVTVK